MHTHSFSPRRSTGDRWPQRRASCSSISFYWALDRKIAGLTAHNIFLADAYKESFDDIFQSQELPDTPSFYVNVPSRLDDGAAPPGCDALVVLVPVGHIIVGPMQDWPNLIARARSFVVSTLTRRLSLAESLSACIVHERIHSPPTWREELNLDRGAILGLAHNFFNMLCFRPQIRHPDVKGLYFVGASTHPGTGVPVVLAGAKIVAEMVLEDCSLRVPWTANLQRNRRGFDYSLVTWLCASTLLLWVAMAGGVRWRQPLD